jgi:hypothetical protein
VLLTSRLVAQAAGLPVQPDCQKIGTIRMPAAAALASSWSSSVKSKVPGDGSTTFHDMLISTLFSPSAFSAARLASDQGTPWLSKKSWVAHNLPCAVAA